MASQNGRYGSLGHFWIQVNLITNRGEKIELIIINTDRFFQFDDPAIKDALLELAKNLTKKLSEELGILSACKGFIDEE